VTEDCALAATIVGGGAGESVGRSPLDLAAGIAALQASYADYALAARRLAESKFDGARFCADYVSLYRELAEEGTTSVAAARLTPQPVMPVLSRRGAPRTARPPSA
jgi:hypothetical protein